MTATMKMVVVEVRPNLLALLFLGFVVVLFHAVSQYCFCCFGCWPCARAFKCAGVSVCVQGCQCVCVCVRACVPVWMGVSMGLGVEGVGVGVVSVWV